MCVHAPYVVEAATLRGHMADGDLKVVNVRLSAEARRVLDAIARREGVTYTAIVEVLCRRQAGQVDRVTGGAVPDHDYLGFIEECRQVDADRRRRG